MMNKIVDRTRYAGTLALMAPALGFAMAVLLLLARQGWPGLYLLPVPAALAAWRKGAVPALLTSAVAVLLLYFMDASVWPYLTAASLFGVYLGWLIRLDVPPQHILWQGPIFAGGIALLWLAWSLSAGGHPIEAWMAATEKSLMQAVSEAASMSADQAPTMKENARHLVEMMRLAWPALGLVSLAFFNAVNLAVVRILVPLWKVKPRPFLPFEFWRIGHPVVWGVTIGIFLVFSGIWHESQVLVRIGTNLFIVFAVPYLIIGLGIASFYLRLIRSGDFLRRLLLALCVVQPLLLQGALWLGVFDTWFDFRRLEMRIEG